MFRLPITWHPMRPFSVSSAPYDSIQDNYPKYVVSLDEFDMRQKRDVSTATSAISCWQGNGIKNEVSFW